MFTSLDLLVILFIVLGGLTLIAIGLMFLFKNPKAKKICFYIVFGLSILMAYSGIYIGIAGVFTLQAGIGIVMGLLSIAALILELTAKKNPKMYVVARILVTFALIGGFINAAC